MCHCACIDASKQHFHVIDASMLLYCDASMQCVILHVLIPQISIFMLLILQCIIASNNVDVFKYFMYILCLNVIGNSIDALMQHVQYWCIKS